MTALQHPRGRGRGPAPEGQRGWTREGGWTPWTVWRVPPPHVGVEEPVGMRALPPCVPPRASPGLSAPPAAGAHSPSEATPGAQTHSERRDARHPTRAFPRARAGAAAQL